MVASISGTKYSDLNFNGVRDSQEAGLENFEIQLLDSSDNVVATTTTDASGFYQFSDLAPGPYVVREVNQPGFVQTQPTFPNEIVAATGNFQSPVDIVNAEPIKFDEILRTSYDGEGAVEIEKTATQNFEIIYEEGSNNFVNLNGEEFEITNFHFHLESEHAVSGARSDMEMHIVHRNPETGGLAVLGVLIEEGEFNEELAPVFDTIDNQLEANGELAETLPFTVVTEIAKVLPDNSGWFYDGSLTTPEFSEEVDWFVFEESIELSPEQIDVFQDYLESEGLDSNNRELQPLDGRQFNELNYQITLGEDSISDLNFGNTPVNEIVGSDSKDTLSGTRGFDSIVGGGGDDKLFGRTGNDTLDGGDGKDLLYGGLGNDVLTGDEGKDTFVLAAGKGADTVSDFSFGDDSLRLSGSLTFADLSFAGNSILVADTKEILATLTDVDATTLTEADFATV